MSGIPASGKTSLGRALASSLEFALLDKDEFLEQLLARAGESAAAHRRALSRRSDDLFRDAALRSHGAILVSFWHVSGMPADSGTPTDWIGQLGHRVIQVHCECDPARAAERFLRRRRHDGHGDRQRSHSELVFEFERLVSLGRPRIEPTISVDTNTQLDLAGLLARIGAALPAA